MNAVSRMVENLWESGWQEYSASNDDAIDGVILMRRGSAKPTDTGGVVFVQVKCGGNGYRQDQKQYPEHIGIALGVGYIEVHRPRWMRVPGPAVLVFVDDSADRMNPPAWWVDLKDECSYSPTNRGMILIPKEQRFAHHTKGDFHRLCGSQTQDRTLNTIELNRTETLIPNLGRTESIRNDAWEFYKVWRSDSRSRLNPTLGEILVNRVGWKHITRRGRLPERIVQSWMLLGAAKQIVAQEPKVLNFGRASIHDLEDGSKLVNDYLGLRSKIIFPYRHHAVVQVVLKRTRIIHPSPSWQGTDRQKIWFYSVYELRRGSLGI
ncbi:DUF4365 domain-containing protein [Pusillimonas noertemannii]|uniref:DUF4365 domain-containing protein n=1 Tax=Pusillimonas noertemannii TaxID=305977 RepID=UPI0012FE6BAC|nr:DUF4365 domain-containing protein [Pusillimonas noertemannii]